MRMFSRLDYPEWSEREEVRKFFHFVNRRFNPVKKGHTTIRKKGRVTYHKMFIELRYYGYNEVHDRLIELLTKSRPNELKKHTVLWTRFLEILKEIE